MKLIFRQPVALFLSGTASTASAFSLRPSSFTRKRFYSSSSLKMSSSASPSSSSSTSTSASTRVALCQFPVTEDKSLNHQTAKDYINKAVKEHQAKLVVLPEIWNGPYATAAFGEYAEELPKIGDDTAPPFESSPSASLLQNMAKEHGIYLIGGSIPERDGDNIYNTCLVLDPTGKVVAKHRKVHLFDIDVPGGVTFRESDTLSPGQTFSVFEANDFGPVGVGICYDIRFPEYALLLRKNHSCKLLVYPGAFNLTTGPAHWELLQRARAVDNQCFVLACSPARVAEPSEPGKYPHYTAWGHSTIVAPWGDIVATMEEGEGIVVADLDMALVDTMRQAIPTAQQKRDDMYQLTESTK